MVTSALSKKATFSGYWFSFHPYQRDMLQSHKRAFAALGCGTKDSILLIPAAEFVPLLDRCNTTERNGKTYWHVHVIKDKEGYALRVKKGAEPVRLNKFLLE